MTTPSAPIFPRDGMPVDVLALRDALSPRSYREWVRYLNRATGVPREDIGDPYVAVTERVPWGWVVWNVDRDLGRLVEDRTRFRPGHVLVQEFVVERPTPPGAQTRLYRSRTKAAAAPAGVQLGGSAWRWWTGRTERVDGVLIASGAGGVMAGVGASTLLSTNPVVTITVTVLTTGAGGMAWLRHQRLGHRNVRRLHVEYDMDSVATLETLVDLAALHLAASTIPDVPDHEGVTDQIRTMMWDLANPALSDDDRDALTARAGDLRAALDELQAAQAEERALLSGLTAPDPALSDTEAGLMQSYVPSTGLTQAEQIRARAAAVRSVTQETARGLGEQ